MKDDEMERARAREVFAATQHSDDCRYIMAVRDGDEDALYVDCTCDRPIRAMLAFAQQPEGWRESIASIATWCDETFGPAGAHRIANRAKEELKELLDETPGDEWTDKARIEAADVVIILLRTPGIWEAIEEKMAINRKRKWRLTGDGCGYHIPAPPAAMLDVAPIPGEE
jgi:hypothetical protein